MQHLKQVEFLGVTLRPLKRDYLHKNCDVFCKGGIVVLRSKSGKLYTNSERIFRPYNATQHVYIAHGLEALGAVSADVVKKWKDGNEQRARERAVSDAVEEILLQLRTLRMKPDKRIMRLVKKHKLELHLKRLSKPL